MWLHAPSCGVVFPTSDQAGALLALADARHPGDGGGLAQDPRPERASTGRPAVPPARVARFVEAGAFGWLRDLGTVDPGRPLGREPGAVRPRHRTAGRRTPLGTAYVRRWSPGRTCRPAAVPHTPLRQATRERSGADLMVCPIEAARDHLLALGYPAERIPWSPPGWTTTASGPADELGWRRSAGSRLRLAGGRQQGQSTASSRRSTSSPAASRARASSSPAAAPRGPGRARRSSEPGARCGTSGTRSPPRSARSCCLGRVRHAPRARPGSGTSSSAWPTSRRWRQASRRHDSVRDQPRGRAPTANLRWRTPGRTGRGIAAIPRDDAAGCGRGCQEPWVVRGAARPDAQAAAMKGRLRRRGVPAAPSTQPGGRAR